MCTAPIPIDKSMHTISSLFFVSTFVVSFNRGQTTRSIPNVFLLCSYSFLLSYAGSATIYKADGKEKTEEDNDVKKKHTFSYPLYICGSYTSAAVIEVL